MEKQGRRWESTTPVTPCNNRLQRSGAHNSRSPIGNYITDTKVKSATEQDVKETPQAASGQYGSQIFDVSAHSCIQDFERASQNQEAAEDTWTKEFHSDENFTDDFDNIFDHQKADTSCLGCDLTRSSGLECGPIGDGKRPAGGMYTDIGVHACSQDLHDFSCYQQQQLDKDESIVVDGGRLGEEDSIRLPCGKRGARKGKSRNNARDDLKKDARQLPSSKHKLGRKKSQGDGKHQLKALVPQPLLQFSNYCIQVIIDLVLLIGECVESLGTQVYARLWLPAQDLGNLKNQLRTFGTWAQNRSKDLWSLLCFCGLWIVRVTKMLCALLFLLLFLSMRFARRCWDYIKRTGDKFGAGSSWRAWVSSKLHMTWTLVKQNRIFRFVGSLLQKWTWKIWPSKSRTDKNHAKTTTGSTGGRSQSRDEVERLLTMGDIPEEDLNPFQVLGVEMDASDVELKKAYRQLAVLVHPDKSDHPRAEEAFKVLRAAWDTVSNPEKRKEYELKRMSETELAKSMNEFLSKLQDDLKEAMNSMMCSKCQGKHRRFEMDRDPENARYCAECGKMHPAEEGDFWAESSMLGLKITYYAMMQGKVFDITEWAGCQRVGISPDTHRVPYHISFGSKNSTNTGRQRSSSESNPTSVADLQNLLNRIFQGTPGQMPNGNIFTPPQPSQGAPSPAGSAKPDSASKSDTKSKRKKKMRRPVQR